MKPAYNEAGLKRFGATIQKLIGRHDLTQEETYAAFREILLDQQPELQQGAFLAALAEKGETTEEIVGAWRAICDFDTVAVTPDAVGPLVDNSGTGMDSLKTFNVSSAAAVIAAACGVRLARHGARALTSFCGTVDILESVGLDVECDVRLVEAGIRQEGIGLFNGMSAKVHPGGLGRILSRIRFGSVLNTAASLANPARPTHGLRGVFARDRVGPVCEVMAAIGYRRGMVVHGSADGFAGGMDELSVAGETAVCEFSASGVRHSYVLRPEDVGLVSVPFGELASLGDRAAETRRFLTVLAGKGYAGCIDFACLNAGALLYLVERVPTLADGVVMARKAVMSGAAVDKLRRWVAVQNSDPAAGVARLDALLSLI